MNSGVGTTVHTNATYVGMAVELSQTTIGIDSTKIVEGRQVNSIMAQGT